MFNTQTMLSRLKVVTFFIFNKIYKMYHFFLHQIIATPSLFWLENLIFIFFMFTSSFLTFSEGWVGVSKRIATLHKYNLLETFVMTFTLFWAARAFKLFPVAITKRLFKCCFCSLGLPVFVKASSKVCRSWRVMYGRESKICKNN